MDALEVLIGIVTFARRWRLSFCIFCTALAGFLLATHVSWVSGLQGIVLGIAGAIPGAIWEERADNAHSPLNSTPAHVEFSAVTLLSAAWGAVSGHGITSFLFGAGLLSVSFLIYQRWGRKAHASRPGAIALGLIAGAAFTSASMVGHRCVLA